MATAGAFSSDSSRSLRACLLSSTLSRHSSVLLFQEASASRFVGKYVLPLRVAMPIDLFRGYRLRVVLMLTQD